MEENSLIHISKNDYGENFQAHLLEQYKVVRSEISKTKILITCLIFLLICL